MPKNNKIDKKVRTKKSAKKKYKVRNWSEYNNSLVERGNIEFWMDPKTLKKWKAKLQGKKGRAQLYTDLSIKITLQFGKVFHQKLRQTEGVLKSIFKTGNIDLPVPDYSTLSKRGGELHIRLPKDKKDNVVLILDSTGLKVYGEGEWKVRQHGISKRRTWRKMHLAVTPDGEVRAVKLTANGTADCDIADQLLNQEDARIEKVLGDGGYDRRKVYWACQKRQVKQIVIPPQKNAKIFQHGNTKTLPPHPRDENLRAIRQSTRKKWKTSVGYHTRSLVENTMFRFKTICGDKLNARNLKNQITECLLSLSILNQMTKLGMPDSYAAV
jgi:hypothetical protein